MKQRWFFIVLLNVAFILQISGQVTTPPKGKKTEARQKEQLQIDEQLASRYYREQDYEKARDLYAQLFEKTGQISHFQQYIECLIILKDYDKAEQLDSTGKQGAVKAVDTLKKSTSKTASGLANAAIRSMQSARSITFEDAYCVSLREHFRVDPKNTGTVDASYPWILEIGIKPSKVTVNGDNFGGATLADEVVMTFFSL